MFKISISVDIPFRIKKWWRSIFKCAHFTVSVEEGFENRYGSRTSYMYCLKCGRIAGELEETCKHEINCFGVCRHCHQRLEKENCEHKEWCNEPDTSEFYCSDCGIWKNDLDLVECELV